MWIKCCSSPYFSIFFAQMNNLNWCKEVALSYLEPPNDFPKMSDNTNKTMNIKNRIFAIDAAPAAKPPNPKIAAIIATMRKVIVQRNIV